MPGLAASLASYSGHLRHGATRQERRRLWAQSPWLTLLLRRDDWAVGLRWRWQQSHGARGCRDRYAAVVRAAGQDCLAFFPLGRFIELYGPQRLLAEHVLGLRRARLPRGGYAFAAGFPVWLEAHFARRALQSGWAVARTGVTRRAPGGTAVAISWPSAGSPARG